VSASPLDARSPSLSPSDHEDRTVLERIAVLLPGLLAAEVSSEQRRARVLGLAWENAHAALRADPAAFSAARSDEELGALVRPALRAAIGAPNSDQSALGTRSGALDTFIDAQLRTPPGAGPDDLAPDADASLLDANPLVADAIANAKERGSQTLLRNLCWMVRRDEGYSYDAIAAESSSPTASVRTGVRRARQAIRRIAQEKRRAANAPHQGECPPELEAARDAWQRGDIPDPSQSIYRNVVHMKAHPDFWARS